MIYKVSRFLLSAFLIFMPFQVRSLIYDQNFYVTGNFNYFSSIFIYFSDLLLLSAFILWVVDVIKNDFRVKIGDKYLVYLFTLFFVFLLLSVIFVADKITALLFVLKYLLLVPLYLLMVNNVLSGKETAFFVIIGVVFQSVIGIFQYSFQSSIGLHFLGEPELSPSTPGVAKIEYAGSKIIRAYGTFSHPNVLAGAILISLWLLYYYFRDNRRFFIPVAIILVLGMIVAFSRTAFAGLICSIFAYIFFLKKDFKWEIPVILTGMAVIIILLFNIQGFLSSRIMDKASIDERLEYLSISEEILVKNPMGIGIGNFTNLMQNYTKDKLMPWTLQPVHNVFLLIANEGGILSAVIFIFAIVYIIFALMKDRNQNSAVLLSILTIVIISFFFDHFFYTIYQGQILFVIYLALVSSFLSNSRLPDRNA